ncbi:MULTISPECIES: glutamate-1-semialdehyde 2,1-aminomutase [Clostridium]|jgi:glutamate-1-semialdehyde 2,1-aminomutase|uniref:glutamate-1-semialdehyde 2,1-aminomutase n=1 Tax=Clostridium TaxID=1485 RepID=UPI00028870F2|nr:MULTISPECIES: glutamate-1-semialdehyde 2,1-aminomutase [Clostridium]MDF2503493.1 hemL [Clostridium sp.]
MKNRANNTKSVELFKRAMEIIPGGVNSPVRAFKDVDMTPPFIVRADGSKIYDEDNNEYIDYIGSYGPMILGHNPSIVNHKLKEQINKSLSFGAPTRLEVEIAELIREIVPSIEMIRMVNSGTEATMSALRVARGYTGRNKIVKFAGNYHGHGDCLLVQAGSGALTHGVPSSSGVPESITNNTIVAEYNSIESVSDIFKEHGKEIAAVIMEPISGNMGVVPATQEFIDYVRKITRQYNSLLIIDEVMTGFRVAIGGAQSLYNVEPDLTCFGKIIGGGLPVGAYGGKKEIMQCVAPLGPVYQAGTLSGNPLSMTAGITTLAYLKDNPKVYVDLENKGKMLQTGIEKAISDFKIEANVNRVGSMMTVFFSNKKIMSYDDAKKCNIKSFAKYFKSMLMSGIYLPPSQFETFFVSNAHSEEDIEKTIKSIRNAFKELSED